MNERIKLFLSFHLPQNHYPSLSKFYPISNGVSHQCLNHWSGDWNNSEKESKVKKNIEIDLNNQNLRILNNN